MANVKLYTNPDRKNIETPKPYVPQYQVLGVEPEVRAQQIAAQNTKVVRPESLPPDNPRGRRAPILQPYAEAVPSPIGKGPVPNVGNSMEHSWASVDGEIVDDMSGQKIDPNHPMVDNNDVVSDQALIYKSGLDASDLQPLPTGKVTIELDPVATSIPSSSEPDNLLRIVSELAGDDFLLIVSGVPVCSGPKEEIEDQARAFVFGEHEMCEGNPIPMEDIIILKRAKIKVGLFLE